MAVLTDEQRRIVWAGYMQDISNNREGITINKTDLRAAVNAIDAWVDSNATSFNQAIPQPARANLTARQKAAILMFVIKKRFEVT